MKVFVDEAQRFVHTDRYFITLSGRPNAVLSQIAVDTASAKHESERKALRGQRLVGFCAMYIHEYVRFMYV